MYSREYYIRCIRDYAQEYLITPRKRMPKGYFELWSYKKSAVKEIIFQINQSDPADNVINIVQSFVDRTLLYSRNCRTRKNRQMMHIMHEMGEDIMDFLYAMEGEKNG